MDDPTRRTVLATGLALAASIALRLSVGDVEPTAEELEAQALALAGLGMRPDAAEPCWPGEGSPPAAVLTSASALLRTIDRASGRVIRQPQTRSLRRASAVAALVCARASRLRAAPETNWLTLAEVQAQATGDKPLQALVRLERATTEGQAARSADAPSPATVDHATRALHEAGSSHSQAAIRAGARFHLAWEYAATGDRRGAVMEVDAGRIEAQRAGWSQPAIDACVGPALRKLGRLEDAELTLSGALDSPPSRRTWVLCDLARTYGAMSEMDMAGEALEEAFLLAKAHGMNARLPRIIAARSVLPPGRALRELDDVLHES